MSAERVAEITKRLQEAFEPESLEVEDDSHRHIGHEGAKGGLGHFNVAIVSEKFNGTRPLARHRMVYAALGELMTTDIHALSIDAVASDEF